MPSILSYFRSEETAQKVKNMLQNLGAEETQVDRIKNSFLQNEYEYSHPINPDSLTLTNSVGDTGQEVGIYNNYNDVGHHNVILTVITSDNNHEECVNIIRQYGGMV
ncbi:hypothetical protein SAMN00017405_1413 [Desulfonispora thiosulfatigenes DSM 11270]|uniref:Uncharacterized protein n=1 Tax=Desulfonispora thiosulfatigenes DSM 11270 TaxID=656914 RepID=A0A1W1VCC4_DESTI|nr:hypothetical protein [Desulfonispora thiosulfatigenes]SMB91059.1 hypothetical protein SAMN00017405_1413 [Desulfonispora thiosulfatigenes DSM 11270]